MATQKKQYVYRLMKAQCSCGAKEFSFKEGLHDFSQYLNLPKDHGVVFNDIEHPLMNANDHVANEHIYSFGRCTSLQNPGDWTLGMLLGGGIPFLGLLAGALFKSFIGCKCEPMTLVPWINIDEDYFIEGAPALTIESVLPCYYGGMITIVAELEGEKTDSEEEDEGPEEKDARELLPSEVQEQIEAFCDSEATNPSSRAEQELHSMSNAINDAVDSLMSSISNNFQFTDYLGDIDFNIPQNIPTSDAITDGNAGNNELYGVIPDLENKK